MRLAMAGMALLMAFSAFAAPQGKQLLYRSLSDFVLMYPTASEPEDGKKVAEYFARVIEKKFNVKLEVVSDSLRHSQPEIMVGQTDRGLSQRFYDAPHTLYDYAVHTDGRNIALCGGDGDFVLYERGVFLRRVAQAGAVQAVVEAVGRLVAAQAGS